MSFYTMLDLNMFAKVVNGLTLNVSMSYDFVVFYYFLIFV